jgi:hypothetical protein
MTQIWQLLTQNFIRTDIPNFLSPAAAVGTLAEEPSHWPLCLQLQTVHEDGYEGDAADWTGTVIPDL